MKKDFKVGDKVVVFQDTKSYSVFRGVSYILEEKGFTESDPRFKVNTAELPHQDWQYIHPDDMRHLTPLEELL